MSAEPEKKTEAPPTAEVKPAKFSFADPKLAEKAIEGAEKKVSTSELLVRIYEVEVYIGKQMHDMNELLATVLANMGKLQAPVVNTVNNAPAPAQPAPVATPTDAKMAKIAASLAEFKNDKNEPSLTINGDENNMFYIIRTTGFLGTDIFAKVARKIKTEFGGEYVSQGKASHFRISKA